MSALKAKKIAVAFFSWPRASSLCWSKKITFCQFLRSLFLCLRNPCLTFYIITPDCEHFFCDNKPLINVRNGCPGISIPFIIMSFRDLKLHWREFCVWTILQSTDSKSLLSLQVDFVHFIIFGRYNLDKDDIKLMNEKIKWNSFVFTKMVFELHETLFFIWLSHFKNEIVY